VEAVFALASTGLTQMEVARVVGVGQTTVSRWLRRGRDTVLSSPMRVAAGPGRCPAECERRLATPPEAYAYLLGQYLGDATIAHVGSDVYRLFVSCCAAYPDIVEECRRAVRAVMPHNALGQRSKPGAVDVTCYSKHWPCVFPQHGPGRKHTRPIVLESWQAAIALDAHPGLFIRGLIHSDGCRTVNRVRKAGTTYSYVRYMFSNRSDDIRALFVEACNRIGLDSRPMGRYGISIARKSSVDMLDQLVGPKS
jgi:hypothetical protein